MQDRIRLGIVGTGWVGASVAISARSRRAGMIVAISVADATAAVTGSPSTGAEGEWLPPGDYFGWLLPAA